MAPRPVGSSEHASAHECIVWSFPGLIRVSAAFLNPQSDVMWISVPVGTESCFCCLPKSSIRCNVNICTRRHRNTGAGALSVTCVIPTLPKIAEIEHSVSLAAICDREVIIPFADGCITHWMNIFRLLDLLFWDINEPLSPQSTLDNGNKYRKIHAIFLELFRISWVLFWL
jgi:hypothetical protein